jgi:hypothetical protein
MASGREGHGSGPPRRLTITRQRIAEVSESERGSLRDTEDVEPS